MGIRRPHVWCCWSLFAPRLPPGRRRRRASEPPRALAYSAPLLGPRGRYRDGRGRGGPDVSSPVDLRSRTLPVTANAAQQTYAGGCDGFVAILAPDRTAQYASYLGGRRQEQHLRAIDADAAGNVYVAGDTSSPDYPGHAGAYDTTCGASGARAS